MSFPYEIDESALDVGRDQPHAHAVADVEPLRSRAPARPRPAGAADAHPGALVGRAGDDARRSVSPIRFCDQQRRRRLAHLALDLVGGVLLLGAVRGELAELVDRVGRRPAGERRLDQPLRDQVGIAPVRRRRVGVVLAPPARSARAGRRPADRARTRPAPAASPPTATGRGSRRGSACRRRSRNVVERARRRARPAAARRARPPASTMRVPALRRVHHAAERGEAVRVEEARGDAVGGDHEVLDQLLGAVRAAPPRRSCSASPSNTGARLDGLEVERALLVAQAAQAACGLVLQPQLLVHPGHRGHRAAASARRPRARRPRRCRRAWRGCAPGAGRRPTPASEPSAATVISITTASRSSPSLSEVRSVDSRSGSIGKMRPAV